MPEIRTRGCVILSLSVIRYVSFHSGGQDGLEGHHTRASRGSLHLQLLKLQPRIISTKRSKHTSNYMIG